MNVAPRRIALFTIASKNYLAYVRVLLRSVAAVHPEFALYLCLVDTLDGEFDPAGEGYTVVPAEQLGIAHFEDMALRYDIMEFNTAVKPYMFQWLFEHTDSDSVIYLDPDIRVYSRFESLVAILAGDVSAVLTPHVLKPIEDGKNPNEYHFLQAGVFNLGFAAFNRGEEALQFLGWWARRLATQADADFARNLFTDQRWCDLAPCLLARLRILREPGYNVAYWNLAERAVTRSPDGFLVNGVPLVFFHFSGVYPDREHVISKHQNRFTWADLPECRPLFDAYREALIAADWETTRTWKYAYALTRQGLPVATVMRHVYRQAFKDSQSFDKTGADEVLIRACNAPAAMVPFDSSSPITQLMELVYRQRPDLQALFNLHSHAGRVGLRNWFANAAVPEYQVPPQTVPECLAAGSAGPGRRRAAARATVDPGDLMSFELADHWARLPTPARTLLGPAVRRMIEECLAAPAVGQDPVQGETPQRIDYLATPAAITQFLGTHRVITELMHLVWSSRPDLRDAFDLGTPDGQAAFYRWYAETAPVEYGPGARQRRPARVVPGKPVAAAPGANLIGYSHAELGMGEHVRMSAAALAGTAVPYGVVNFNIGVASRQQARLEHGELRTDNPFRANIFHINADQMLRAYCHLDRPFFRDRYNVGYWAWELSLCPPEWQHAIRMMDEIWAPSHFIREAFAARADIPVVYMPLCVVLPSFQSLGRAHFGIPAASYAFLYVFDFFSFMDRKNPFAAIHAFRRAFPDRSTAATLVLKVMNGRDDSASWQRMMALIDGDRRIIIINETLSRAAVLALFEACDSFLSLHRSEGFGRGPAEAMYLGKPVVVTNYSGNTDFTLPDNACLVDYRLIPVEEGQYPFPEGQVWADADVEHAAWYMRRLYDDRAYGNAIGARARAFIHQNYSQEAIGSLYATRLRELGLA